MDESNESLECVAHRVRFLGHRGVQTEREREYMHAIGE